jgi:hypothetical protein
MTKAETLCREIAELEGQALDLRKLIRDKRGALHAALKTEGKAATAQEELTIGQAAE